MKIAIFIFLLSFFRINAESIEKNLNKEFIVTDSVVNVRFSHSIDSQVIGTVKFKEIVFGLSYYLAPQPKPELNESYINFPYWIKINYKDTTGYVSGEFLAEKDSCIKIQDVFSLCMQQRSFSIPYGNYALSTNFILFGEKVRWNLSQPNIYYDKNYYDYEDSINSSIYFNDSFQDFHLIVIEKCGYGQAEGDSTGGRHCALYFWKIKDNKLSFINYTVNWSSWGRSIYNLRIEYDRNGWVGIDKENHQINFKGEIKVNIEQNKNKPKIIEDSYDYKMKLEEISKYNYLLDKKENSIIEKIPR